jgi:hypothetical protein
MACAFAFRDNPLFHNAILFNQPFLRRDLSWLLVSKSETTKTLIVHSSASGVRSRQNMTYMKPSEEKRLDEKRSRRRRHRERKRGDNRKRL